MKFVNCSHCGARVDITKGNAIKIDTGYVHKKCPKKSSKKEVDKTYKELTDYIVEAHSKYATEEAYLRGLNWSLITTQIKELKTEGFSYEDQKYCLGKCVERDGVYFGYGRVKKFIHTDTAKRKRYLEASKQTQSKTESIDEFEYNSDSYEWGNF